MNPKHVLCLLGLLLVFTAPKAQTAVAKLKFEDAETAYNAGDYIKAIKKLAESEKLFGKINSPILHLRILAQDKLFAQTGQVELGFELKRNCAAFLKDYADVEALEEKYKEVYRINENLAEVAGSPEELVRLKEKKNREYEEGKLKYLSVMEQYLSTIGGNNQLASVKTIELEKEMSPIGYMEINGKNYSIVKIYSTQRVQNKTRYYLKHKEGNTLTTFVSTPGTLQWLTKKTITKGDKLSIDLWNKRLNIFPEMAPLTDKDSVSVTEFSLEGKRVFITTKKQEFNIEKCIFDAQTGMKIYEFFKGFLSGSEFFESETHYKTHREVEGIKYPDSYNYKWITTVLQNPGQSEVFIKQSKQKLAEFDKAGSRILFALSATQSLQPNDLKTNVTKLTYEVKLTGIKINPDFREKDLEF
ncbi:MAG: hypothetical protein ACK5A2_12770 [Bacteroidota bacterium]|jgi:hypothetical protein